MALIRGSDRKTLRAMAEQMRNDVALTLYTQRKSPIVVPDIIPCGTCETTERLVSELDELLPRLNVTVLDLVANSEKAAEQGIDRVPALVLNGTAGGRVRFFGIPAGYEFAAFLGALMEVGGAREGIDSATRTKLDEIKNPIDLKVFATPT
jgi:alkyl hydroperoxide reductase subunit AhpF